MELLTVSELKDFLHIEFDDDDVLLTSAIEGAEGYIKNHLSVSSSFSASFDNNELPVLKIATFQLASHFYENRDLNAGKNSLSDAGLKIVNPLRSTL